MEGLKAQRLNQIDYAKPKKKAITAEIYEAKTATETEQ